MLKQIEFSWCWFSLAQQSSKAKFGISSPVLGLKKELWKKIFDCHASTSLISNLLPTDRRHRLCLH